MLKQWRRYSYFGQQYTACLFVIFLYVLAFLAVLFIDPIIPAVADIYYKSTAVTDIYGKLFTVLYVDCKTAIVTYVHIKV